MNEEIIIRTEYHIHRFMYDLGIRNSGLTVYAALYSFTAGETGVYYGSAEYLANSLGLNEKTVRRAYNSLFEKELIEKYTSEDGRFSGIRCVSLLRVEEKKQERLREARRAQEEFAAELNEKIEERKAAEAAEKSPEAHLKRIDELCARINQKIKDGTLNTPVRAEKKEKDSRYFSENLPEHERNTFIMMHRYEKEGDNRKFLSFGKSGSVRMTEPQYEQLLELLPSEELMPYLAKLEIMLEDNLKTGRKPPHSHYKTVRKWIEEDTAL